MERYQNVHIIGQGVQGKVYQVVDLKLNKECVLEIFQNDYELFFDTEVSILKQLGDCTDHFVCFYDSFKNMDGNFVIVMELVRGDTIKKIFKHASLSLIWIVVYQQLISFDLLHKKGICHGDVGYQNLLWTGSHVKIIDFGNSHQLTVENIYTDEISLGNELANCFHLSSAHVEVDGLPRGNVYIPADWEIELVNEPDILLRALKIVCLRLMHIREFRYELSEIIEFMNHNYKRISI
jgi:serine/threonine protein kinase